MGWLKSIACAYFLSRLYKLRLSDRRYRLKFSTHHPLETTLEQAQALAIPDADGIWACCQCGNESLVVEQSTSARSSARLAALPQAVLAPILLMH